MLLSLTCILNLSTQCVQDNVDEAPDHIQQALNDSLPLVTWLKGQGYLGETSMNGQQEAFGEKTDLQCMHISSGGCHSKLSSFGWFDRRTVAFVGKWAFKHGGRRNCMV